MVSARSYQGTHPGYCWCYVYSQMQEAANVWSAVFTDKDRQSTSGLVCVCCSTWAQCGNALWPKTMAVWFSTTALHFSFSITLVYKYSTTNPLPLYHCIQQLGSKASKESFRWSTLRSNHCKGQNFKKHYWSPNWFISRSHLMVTLFESMG